MGARVEIERMIMMQERMCVAPLVGARVEIKDAENALSVSYEVAPLVGARVEMLRVPTSRNKDTVAPLVGARVEIPSGVCLFVIYRSSLPSWERGLKYP